MINLSFAHLICEHLPMSRLLRITTLISLCAQAVGCTSTPTPAPQAQPAARPKPVQTQCPAPTLEVEPTLCQGLPSKHGQVPELPLEWGVDVVGEQLWFGRLVCEDGAMPKLRLEGVYGPAPKASLAPPSPTQSEALDLLDRWTLRCPGQPAMTLYYNLYRCGSPCPPLGVSLLPAAAFKDYLASLEAHGARRLEEAYELATRALDASPESELFRLWLATLANERGLHERALLLYEEAAARYTSDAQLQLRRAETLLLLDRPREAEALLTKLLDALPSTHKERPYSMCLHATAVMLFDLERSAPLARAACQAGASSCCE